MLFSPPPDKFRFGFGFKFVGSSDVAVVLVVVVVEIWICFPDMRADVRSRPGIPPERTRSGDLRGMLWVRDVEGG